MRWLIVDERTDFADAACGLLKRHGMVVADVQAVKDMTLALNLAKGGGAPPPVTEAARDAYR